MADNEHDDLQKSITSYYGDIDIIQDMLAPTKRLSESALLVENVIGNHFLPPDVENSGLATLLRLRQSFLDPQLFEDADFALQMRNRILHQTHRSAPTDEELAKATSVFLEVVRKHLEEMESRGGNSQAPTIASPEGKAAKLPETRPRFGNDVANKIEKPKTYATHIDHGAAPLLAAVGNDPKLTVSTVAEYEFCPRAGILTHEGGFSDPEEELPSLALLPWYEQDAVEEAYVKAAYILFALPVGLVAFVLILSLMFLGYAFFPILLMGVVLAWIRPTVRAYQRWREWGKRKLAADHPTECNPVPNKNAFQPVDWWGLLHAGYEVRSKQPVMHDGPSRLSGKPRRILDKGTMSIPVHRIRKNEGPILPQHIVRVTAHCYLIEQTEGAESPFAVVLFGDTYQGMTVPYTAENRELFSSALKRARAMITDSDAGDREPPEPVTGNPCIACHFGEPRPTTLVIKTMKHGVEINPTRFGNGMKRLHCDCGDRFRWKPRHKANEKLSKLE